MHSEQCEQDKKSLVQYLKYVNCEQREQVEKRECLTFKIDALRAV
jgi:hypothetical protein